MVLSGLEARFEPSSLSLRGHDGNLRQIHRLAGNGDELLLQGPAPFAGHHAVGCAGDQARECDFSLGVGAQRLIAIVIDVIDERRREIVRLVSRASGRAQTHDHLQTEHRAG